MAALSRFYELYPEEGPKAVANYVRELAQELSPKQQQIPGHQRQSEQQR